MPVMVLPGAATALRVGTGALMWLPMRTAWSDRLKAELSTEDSHQHQALMESMYVCVWY